MALSEFWNIVLLLQLKLNVCQDILKREEAEKMGTLAVLVSEALNNCG